MPVFDDAFLFLLFSFAINSIGVLPFLCFDAIKTSIDGISASFLIDAATAGGSFTLFSFSRKWWERQRLVGEAEMYHRQEHAHLPFSHSFFVRVAYALAIFASKISSWEL